MWQCTAAVVSSIARLVTFADKICRVSCSRGAPAPPLQPVAPRLCCSAPTVGWAVIHASSEVAQACKRTLEGTKSRDMRRKLQEYFVAAAVVAHPHHLHTVYARCAQMCWAATHAWQHKVATQGAHVPLSLFQAFSPPVLLLLGAVVLVTQQQSLRSRLPHQPGLFSKPVLVRHTICRPSRAWVQLVPSNTVGTHNLHIYATRLIMPGSRRPATCTECDRSGSGRLSVLPQALVAHA